MPPVDRASFPRIVPATDPQRQPKPQQRRRPRQTLITPADDDVDKLATIGWAIVALFFGVLGSWSLLAPLNGAVVASGFVKVDGNRKSLQHHDGGTGWANVELLSCGYEPALRRGHSGMGASRDRRN